MKTITNIKKVLPFLNLNKKTIILLLFLGIITSAIASVLPTINGLIINNMLKLSFKTIIILAILGGIFQIINTLLTYFTNKKYFIIRKQFITDIRKQLSFSLINSKNNVYNDEGTGALLNKIKNDTKMLADFLTEIKDGIIGLILNLCIIIYIIYLNYIIGIYYLISLILSIIIRYYGIKKALKYQKISIQEGDINDNNLSEIIKGEKDIKVTNLKHKFLEKSNNQIINISNNLYKSSSSNELYISLAKLLESVMSGVMVILSVFLIKNNLLTVQTFIIIFMYKGNVFLFPSKFGILISSLGKFNISADRIFSVLDNSKENYGNINTTLKGEITFKNVYFYYKKQNKIFNNLNLNIKQNTYTVITGKNGTGKSTLLNLIAKIIEPVKGEIYIDNYKLNDLSENTIRNNIVLINQQPYLFNYSIYENLALVNDDIEKIKETCKLVDIHNKIITFKDGYDTIIGTDACNLSGGEKQKLAIARALLTNAKILLFDEITNNLDKESINSISKLIDKLKNNYTIIMITHNKILSKPDKIIKIENKKIKEMEK